MSSNTGIAHNAARSATVATSTHPASGRCRPPSGTGSGSSWTTPTRKVGSPPLGGNDFAELSSSRSSRGVGTMGLLSGTVTTPPAADGLRRCQCRRARCPPWRGARRLDRHGRCRRLCAAVACVLLVPARSCPRPSGHRHADWDLGRRDLPGRSVPRRPAPGHQPVAGHADRPPRRGGSLRTGGPLLRDPLRLAVPVEGVRSGTRPPLTPPDGQPRHRVSQWGRCAIVPRDAPAHPAPTPGTTAQSAPF